jgi:hypothetical protein
LTTAEFARAVSDPVKQAALDAATAGNTRIYCSLCGKSSMPGSFTAMAGGYCCPECWRAFAEKAASKADRLTAAAARATRLCNRCRKKPALDSYATCKECHDQSVDEGEEMTRGRFNG